jgi:hypothetical protein
MLISSLVFNLFATAVLANPINRSMGGQRRHHVVLKRQTITTPTGVTPQCAPFLIGKKSYDTQVCLDVSGPNLTVTYPVTADFTYTDVRVWVNTTLPPHPPQLGQYPYSIANGYCEYGQEHQGVQCTIPINLLSIPSTPCGMNLNIVAHASIVSPTHGEGDIQAGTAGDKSWMDNWFRYFSFVLTCSTTTTTSQGDTKQHWGTHGKRDKPQNWGSYIHRRRTYLEHLYEHFVPDQ